MEWTICGFAPAGGYQLLLLDGATIVDQAPILSFMVSRKPREDSKKGGYLYSVEPVTAEAVYDEHAQEHALLRPDGKVDLPFDQTFDSIDEFKKYLHERATANAAIAR